MADTIFNIFDEDHNGCMDEKEFRKGMHSLTGTDDEAEILYVFEQVSRPDDCVNVRLDALADGAGRPGRDLAHVSAAPAELGL
eukprot:7476555-Pyramimonas_sp.AAC.1